MGPWFTSWLDQNFVLHKFQFSIALSYLLYGRMFASRKFFDYTHWYWLNQRVSGPLSAHPWHPYKIIRPTYQRCWVSIRVARWIIQVALLVLIQSVVEDPLSVYDLWYQCGATTILDSLFIISCAMVYLMWGTVKDPLARSQVCRYSFISVYLDSPLRN